MTDSTSVTSRFGRNYGLRVRYAGMSAIAACITVAACTSTRPSVPPPDAFTARTPFTSCGQTKTAGPGASLDSRYPQAALDCLARGRAGAGAEWSFVASTTEGDPITTYYRAAANTQQVEIFLDRSRDSHWQGQGWTQLSCTVPIITGANLRACTSNI